MAIVYKKFGPGYYVLQVKKGKIIKEGVGLSMLYNTNFSSIIMVPSTAFDAGFVYDDIVTKDFQRINVQGEISFQINNYKLAAKKIDFTYSEKKAECDVAQNTAKQALNKKVINLTKVYTAKFLADKDIREAIRCMNDLAGYLYAELCEDVGIKEYGIRIIGVTILAIVPQPETRKALEAATKEQIMKEQDDAIYMRRNAAIEQERIIKENELKTEIKIAEKEKEKSEKELEKERMVQEKKAELQKKKMADNIELEKKNSELVSMQTENEKKRSEAKAYESKELMKAFDDVKPEVVEALALAGMDSSSIIAKAFMDIGNNAEKIGVLNVTPDLLEKLTDKNR